jgi:hypothetical protein
MKSMAIQAKLSFLIAAAQCVLSAEPVLASSGESTSTNLAGPKIQFASAVYDFGRVVAGEQVRHDFIFTNTGDAVLEISGVYPSCGCTTAGVWSRQIEPGKTGTIPLQFNSSHFTGAVAKTANVVSNDKGQSQVTLQIIGTIWKPIEVNPQTAVLNVVNDSSSNPPTTVTIVSSLDEPVSLSDPESNTGAFAAELKTIRPGKEFQLVIRTVPPLRQGNTQGTITVKTSSVKVPSVQVTVLAIVQPGVVVTPQQITLPPGPLSAMFPLAVSVRNNRSDPLILSEPVVTAEGVALELKEVVPGRQFTLTLIFPAGFQVAQGREVELTVKSSDSSYPVIKVPVHQGLHTGPGDIGLPGHHRGPVPPSPPGVAPTGGS